MFTLEEPEIDHAIKLLFPGVVKKPMKLLKMNRTKMEDKFTLQNLANKSGDM